MINDLYHVKNGRLSLRFHPGQLAAWNSQRRFVLVIAGTQSGKTTFGPPWFYREIQTCGPGDYIIATPTFPLLYLKALPTFRRYFEDILQVGRYIGSPVRRFEFSPAGSVATFGAAWKDNPEPTTVFFGHAQDPDSLESATAKAAWLDEFGQKKFKYDSFLAIRRRLALHRGRILGTTTPYSLGWVKQQLYNRWRQGDTRIDVIRFDSTTNPAFSREEYEEAKRELPLWKFNLFYRGIFTRPAGLIYDSFSDDHKRPRFAIPAHWPRYLGLDFGGVNTAALFFAQDPNSSPSRFYLYRQYKTGKRTAAEHARAILAGEPGIPTAVGGSRSEGQWRHEFAAAGLPIRAPTIKDVEVGIDRVWGAHKEGRILVFEDLDGYLDEKWSYSRELDATGEPTEEIEDKSSYHYMDAERYISTHIFRPTAGRSSRSRQG